MQTSMFAQRISMQVPLPFSKSHGMKSSTFPWGSDIYILLGCEVGITYILGSLRFSYKSNKWSTVSVLNDENSRSLAHSTSRRASRQRFRSD